MRVLKILALALLPVLAPPHSASAEDFPTRRVRLVVPFAAGGGLDAFARLYGAKLQAIWKVPVIVENFGGAGGNIGANNVAKSPPDGYSILLAVHGHAISPALFKTLSYDPDKELMPVTQLVATTTILVVSPKLPVNTLQELVALAKAKPGAFNYGSTGVGNSLHLTMELLKRETGMDVQMVPFRGDAPMYQALLANDVQMSIVPTATVFPYIESKTIRAIGVTSAKRVPALPDLPTLQEQGLAKFDMSGWTGAFIQGGSPPEAAQAIWKASVEVFKDPDFASKMPAMGLVPVLSSPGDFAAAYRADREKYARIIKDARIAQQD